MKFTNEDLMKAMGLQVGDRVKCIFMDFADEGLGNRILEVHKFSVGNIFLIGEDKGQYPLPILLNRDFEILPRPKRVGDLKCGEIKNCRTCSLQWICYVKIDEIIEMETSLYEKLDSFAVEDQEIYDLLKARLDKEVKEEDKAKELFKWRVRIGEYGEAIADGWVYANSITEAENKVKKHYTNCYHNVEIYEDYDPSNDKDVMCGLEDYKKYDNDVFIRWED